MISVIRDANRKDFIAMDKVKYYQNQLVKKKWINREGVKMNKPSNPNIKIKKQDVKNTVMRLLK